MQILSPHFIREERRSADLLYNTPAGRRKSQNISSLHRSPYYLLLSGNLRASFLEISARLTLLNFAKSSISRRYSIETSPFQGDCIRPVAFSPQALFGISEKELIREVSYRAREICALLSNYSPYWQLYTTFSWWS